MKYLQSLAVHCTEIMMLKGVLICLLVSQCFIESEAGRRFKKGKKSNAAKLGNVKAPRQGKANSARQCTDTCAQDIYDSMKYNRDQVGNFLRQKNRLENFLKVQSKKLQKQDDYVTYANDLALGLGSNTSTFLCGIKNQGDQLANATSTYEALNNCSANIVASCTKNTTIISPEIEAELADCKTKMDEFQTKVDACIAASIAATDATVSTTCTCWAEAKALVDAIKAQRCSATTVQNQVKAGKNACVADIIACKKLQFKVPGLLSACQVDPLNADKTIQDIVSNRNYVQVNSGF